MLRRIQLGFVALVVLSLVLELALATRAVAGEAAPAAKASTASAAQPMRVAVLLPWAGDAVALAGPGVTVVANVRRALHQPVAEGQIDLGNPHSPSLERLSEARPALVVGDASIHGRFAEPIARLGARLLLLDTATVDATFASLSKLAEAIGDAPALTARIAETRDRLTALTGRSAGSVVALFGAPGTFYVMTERAWLGDLVRRLGLTLAVEARGDERFPGLVAVSDELIATAKPDLVLLVAHGDSTRIRADLERRTQSDGAWAGLAGARMGLHVLDPALFSANPGLELARAAEVLAQLVASADGQRARVAGGVAR